VISENIRRPEGDQSGWKRAAPPLLLVLISALPYINSLRNGFVYDDDFQVLANPYLLNFHYLRQIFTTSVWSFKGGAGGATNYYRPMMSLGYLLLYQLFGPKPLVFHAANLLVHIGVVLLVYKVTERIFPKLGLVTAIVFALHPVHSESVDWVGAITDLELSLFYLAAFYFYLRIPRLAEPRLDWRRLRMQAAAVVALALAMLSKEQALTLPVLATLYEHFYRDDRGETGTGEKIARYAPLWLLVPVYLIVRQHFLGGFTAVISRPSLALDECVLSAVALIGQYAGKVLWPAHLCMYYVFPHNWQRLLPAVLGGTAALTLGAFLFAVLWKKARLVSFGLVWFTVTLVPVLNVRWMPEAAFAERYLYLPSVGLSWVIAWALIGLWNAAGRQGRVWRTALALLGTGLAALAVARVVTRNRDWKDEVVLFRQTLAVSPDAYAIHTDLGKVYWDRDQRSLAEQEWQTAAELSPNTPVTLNNLGLLLTSEHRYDEAISNLRRAIQVSPSDTMAHLDLGIAYDELGRRHDAEQELRTAVSLSPLSILARNQLGQILTNAGRFADAEVQFRASLAAQPNLGGWLGLGLARWRQGDVREAESDFKQAQAAGSRDARIHFLMALLYSSTGRKAEAMKEYQAGLRVDPANSQAQAEFQKLQLEMSDDNSAKAAPNAQ
jgi:Flp pilus assembly protein TadD